MNTKIGTSFGLALLMVIAAIATMFAMGMLTPKPASAAIGVVDTVVSPATAMSEAQYTITVTGVAAGAGITAIPVGGIITVAFGTKFTVPASIPTSAVKLKASVVSAGVTAGTAGELVDAAMVTITGRSVAITVPDMEKTTGSGDQGIGSSTGVGADVVITFTQAAGIVNPKLAQDAQTAALTTSGRSLTVTSDAETAHTAIASSLNAITAFTKFTPSTAARAAEVTVTGGGFTASCDDCKIRLNPQAAVAPTTGAGGVAYNGTGTIDADGKFTGTILLGSGTKAGGYVWITDAIGVSKVSTTAFVQKASATPTSTSSKPGSIVSVDLKDYTASGTLAADSVYIGGVQATLYSTSATAVSSAGATATLTPLKFIVPAAVGVGTHKVVVTESVAGTKSANFMLTIALRSITVTPNDAAPGQAITISGTGFGASKVISAGNLTMQAGTVTTLATVNAADISIDTLGAWDYATTMPTLEAVACSACSSTIVFTATDTTAASSGGPYVGESGTDFTRTARGITVSPSSVSPGGALTVSVTGFAVSPTSTGATFDVAISGMTLVGTTTFPIGSDGTGVGSVTIPTTVTAGTKTITVTDNAPVIYTSALVGATGLNAEANTKQIKVSVPKGTITMVPTSASTGSTITLSGSNFPPNTTAATLTIGAASAMPVGGILTDANGAFEQIVEVPAATAGGSLTPGTQIVSLLVGAIVGSSTAFSAPNPTVTITPGTASVEDVVTITGVGFNSLGTVTTLNIGSASALPSPAPRASRSGDITTDVTVPLLNPGTYTVTMSNATTGFTASTTFIAVAAKVTTASTADNTEIIFADVISNDDNLVRVWRFSNADQSWSFYDPRPAFADANTLAKTGAGDIVWVNVTAEQTFQDSTLFPGWNLISLK
jgi:hypothetical protein